MSKQILIQDLKNIKEQLKSYDGETQGQTQQDAINDETEKMADAVEAYFERAIEAWKTQRTVIITPANIVAGALANSGGPVAAANNVTGIIQ